MNEFLAFVRKEFRHILRDKRTMMIVLILPVVQMILFGFAVRTEIENARVDVVGDISDPEVRRIVDRIDNNKYLEIGEILPSTGMIASRFEKNEADAAVCFGQDFSSGIGKTGRGQVKIIGDGSDPNSAQMVVNYVMGVLRDEQADVSAALSGQEALSDNAPSVQLMYNPAMKSAYNFVPGVMGLILMMICSMMTSVSIVREKEMGTMELLLVAWRSNRTAVTLQSCAFERKTTWLMEGIRCFMASSTARTSLRTTMSDTQVFPGASSAQSVGIPTEQSETRGTSDAMTRSTRSRLSTKPSRLVEYLINERRRR